MIDYLYNLCFGTKKRNWITTFIVWLLEIILIVVILLYNQYLKQKYGPKKGIIFFFKVLGDQSYTLFFVWGLIGILLLICLFFFQLLFGFKNSNYILRQLLLCLVSLLLLICLLYVYSNPILIAFAIGMGCVGLISLSQY